MLKNSCPEILNTSNFTHDIELQLAAVLNLNFAQLPEMLKNSCPEMFNLILQSWITVTWNIK